MKKTHFLYALVALALLGAMTLGARAATVTATLDPADISLGDTTQLTVTVTGSQESVQMPSVPGLDINSVAQSNQIEVINGSVTINSSTTYTVTAEHEGTFTIPAIRAGGASSQPIRLHVGQGSGGAVNAQALPPPNVAPAPNSGPVVMPAPGSVPSPNRAPLTAQTQYGWVQLVMPKRELYLGELVPVEVKAYIRDGVPVQGIGLPQFSGDGVALGQLDNKPAQGNEVVGGRSYGVLTWHSAIAAAKTGDFALSLKMPLQIVVPPQMPQMDADDFNSFFRNAFAAMGQRKDVNLTNSGDTVRVLPLPAANRPADFSGAVGHFDIEAGATPTQVNAGDPITLRLRVTGRGNFDRVNSGMLAPDANWKTYSPKSSFEPADSVGYEGTKTFEQPVIPNDGSVTSIPSVRFSFFDPEMRQVHHARRRADRGDRQRRGPPGGLERGAGGDARYVAVRRACTGAGVRPGRRPGDEQDRAGNFLCHAAAGLSQPGLPRGAGGAAAGAGRGHVPGAAQAERHRRTTAPAPTRCGR